MSKITFRENISVRRPQTSCKAVEVLNYGQSCEYLESKVFHVHKICRRNPGILSTGTKRVPNNVQTGSQCSLIHQCHEVNTRACKEYLKVLLTKLQMEEVTLSLTSTTLLHGRQFVCSLKRGCSLLLKLGNDADWASALSFSNNSNSRTSREADLSAMDSSCVTSQ